VFHQFERCDNTTTRRSIDRLVPQWPPLSRDRVIMHSTRIFGNGRCGQAFALAENCRPGHAERGGRLLVEMDPEVNGWTTGGSGPGRASIQLRKKWPHLIFVVHFEL
jgi:hypothetical protein